MSRGMESLLETWRAAAREWGVGSRKPEAAAKLARAWLDYQVAVGAVGDDEIVLVADDRGCYVAANAAAERYLGLDIETIVTLSVADLTPPSERGGLRDAWSSFLSGGRAEGRYALWRRDGQEVPATFRATANMPGPGLHTSRLTPLVGWRSLAESATASATAAGSAPAAARASNAIARSRELRRVLRGAPASILARATPRPTGVHYARHADPARSDSRAAS